jgi:hypothetical protein
LTTLEIASLIIFPPYTLAASPSVTFEKWLCRASEIF